ncbi:hypothetical protein F5B21DRAFT_504326 [Xylaria acuta]|nr:hypothetical protein F5B21DRAFT_504326 [Xylaria acuta]
MSRRDRAMRPYNSEDSHSPCSTDSLGIPGHRILESSLASRELRDLMAPKYPKDVINQFRSMYTRQVKEYRITRPTWDDKHINLAKATDTLMIKRLVAALQEYAT